MSINEQVTKAKAAIEAIVTDEDATDSEIQEALNDVAGAVDDALDTIEEDDEDLDEDELDDEPTDDEDDEDRLINS